MVARMSAQAKSIRRPSTERRFTDILRSEFPLLIGLGTAAIFLWAGTRLTEIIGHPVVLIVVFFWLFGVILWSAICVVRHADCLAIKLGEPYGTLILTISAI